MKTLLNKILEDYEKEEFAKKIGTEKHIKMQEIIIDSDLENGDKSLIYHIKQNKELLPFFSKKSKTEVPIAGYINGIFVSRRIDRLIIKDEEIQFIDYKTDTNKDKFKDKYIEQLKEYNLLLKDIYKDKKISGYILWLTDFTLEQVI